MRIIFGAKLAQDHTEVVLMVSFVRGVDDYIVDVDGAEGCELLEQEVLGPLEHCGGVAEAERHDTELERFRSRVGRRCVHGARRQPGSGGTQTGGPSW